MTVAFFRLVVAAFSSFVIVHRTPSMVLRQTFASSGVPRSHKSQSSSAKIAGIRSVGSVLISWFASTVTMTQAGRLPPISSTSN